MGWRFTMAMMRMMMMIMAHIFRLPPLKLATTIISSPSYLSIILFSNIIARESSAQMSTWPPSTHPNQHQVMIIHTINSKNKMITDFELLVDCLPIILQAQCPISVLALQATFPILPWIAVFHFIVTESDHCHLLTLPGADEKKVLDAVSWCWWKRWPKFSDSWHLGNSLIKLLSHFDKRLKLYDQRLV